MDQTRKRIIDVARGMFGAGGFHNVGLEEVARRANVGRKTIYYQFGSKLGLLRALVADLNERGLVSIWLSEALDEPDVEQAVRKFVQGTAAFWEAENPIVRALTAMAASDADARAVVDLVARSRRADLGKLASRAKRTGVLRADWTAERVADAWWLMTSFESYDLLRRIDRTPTQATRQLVALALSLLDA